MPVTADPCFFYKRKKIREVLGRRGPNQINTRSLCPCHLQSRNWISLRNASSLSRVAGGEGGVDGGAVEETGSREFRGQRDGCGV